MKKIAVVFSVVAAAAINVSCMSTFTPSLRSELTANDVGMDEIQFYNSDYIELSREIKIREIKASKGAFVKEKEDVDVSVVFRRLTPGAFIKEDGDRLLVSFDERDSSKFLPFRLKGGKYVLDDSTGHIQYGDIEYEITEGRGSYLQIRTDVSDDNREKKYVVKGRTVKKHAPKKEPVVE